MHQSPSCSCGFDSVVVSVVFSYSPLMIGGIGGGGLITIRLVVLFVVNFRVILYLINLDRLLCRLRPLAWSGPLRLVIQVTDDDSQKVPL